MTYLTAEQCRMILGTSHYSTPVTESWTDYLYYRGQHKASVLTLRFNINETFSPEVLERVLLDRLTFYFDQSKSVEVIIDYDFLLRGDQPDSFYIWRANSNQHYFDESQEFNLSITPRAIHDLSITLTSDPTDLLENNFFHSRVHLERLLAVVCSFMQYR